MPAYSTLLKVGALERVLKLGTPLTIQLNRIFEKPGEFRDNPHFADFMTQGHLDVIDEDCRKSLGMDQATIDHLNHEWPNSQKEKARVAIVDGVTNGRQIIFSWKLTDGSSKDTTIFEDDGKIRVAFFSPKREVMEAIKAMRERESARLSGFSTSLSPA